MTVQEIKKSRPVPPRKGTGRDVARWIVVSWNSALYARCGFVGLVRTATSSGYLAFAARSKAATVSSTRSAVSVASNLTFRRASTWSGPR